MEEEGGGRGEENLIRFDWGSADRFPLGDCGAVAREEKEEGPTPAINPSSDDLAMSGS